ncbi:MAG: DUF3467 domain-containing protein [Prevotella sp.]|nr:DUF3467 domain-containing protein [Prevotella sp.]
MDNQNKNQGPQLQIEVSPDVAQGVYSNFAIISHTSSEFIVDLAAMMPGVPKATVRSRVILTPEHTKRLAMALQENIAKYEQEFGRIQLPSRQPRTISPFNINNKGEA